MTSYIFVSIPKVGRSFCLIPRFMVITLMGKLKENNKTNGVNRSKKLDTGAETDTLESK